MRMIRANFIGAATAAAVFALALTAIAADPKPPSKLGSLSASADTASAKIGRVAVITLKFVLPPGAYLPEKPAMAGFEELTVVGFETGADQIRLKILVDRLESIKTGTIALTYLDGNQNPQTLTADPVTIQVVTGLGDKPAEAQLRPLRDIMPIKPPWLRYLPWAASALGLLAAIGAVVWWLKERSRRFSPAVLKDPPHVWAGKELDRLEKQALFEKGKTKEYYFRLSEILRRYLEAIRGFPAAEYTIEEIARHARLEVDQRLLALLRRADLVKFADASPTQVRKDEDISLARAYIRETGPPPESAPAVPEAAA